MTRPTRLTADRSARQAVDTDPGQVALRGGDLCAGLADHGQRGTPGISQPR
jgi:hypothetical protein